MKTSAFLAGAVCALSAAAAFGAFARRARAVETAPATTQLISDLKDTEVYAIKFENHTCFVASTKGGSGISLQCPR